MTLSLTSFFFLMPLLAGSILSISSSSWFGAWIGLELNLLSFIPLITTKMNPYSSEAALKYFLIQALGSTIIILSSSLFISSPTYFLPLGLLALLLKLGAAPFHYWFPQVMEGLSWFQAFILLSIQKLAPMFLISYLVINPMLIKIILLSASLSAIIGALGGLNLMKLRKILAFSSINHMSWMLIAISINDMMWMMYYMFYIIISLSVIILFNSANAFSISDLLIFNNTKSFFSLSLPLSLLSLGGLPPFTGFIPKWMMIQSLLSEKMFIILTLLLFSALITLYYYLRIMIPFLLMSNPTLFINIKLVNPFSSNLFLPLITFFNFIGLILPIPFLFI
uniref:NADH-ubiquinone oxidoreductase chain 2 n=1 Tax=Myomenippe fornasinii TaxID=1511596 RepID=A0A068WAT6_9EUCA|nr:NADH dehydrogenase subunit 2 [Myomenippe fornasinii]CDR98408.1 NADH dehydrogenase subunit 2 [Myomenippe fornasinii]